MTVYATTNDVADAWRTLTADEEIVARTKLAFASAIIRNRVADVDTRIIAGTLDAELVKHVAVEMTLRHLRNPEGWRQEAIEDFSRTRDSAMSAGAVYMTGAEIALLSKRGRRAFSITLGCESATHSYLNQESWRT